MYLPSPKKPRAICINPDNRKTVSMAGKALLTSPSYCAIIPAIITILKAVIGAVGPDICVSVPPNRAAKKAINMAPYSPAVGPKPELNPKASARGKATIPAVIPPNRSPLK